MREFSADIARYKAKGYRGRQLWCNPAIWSIASYRLSNWVQTSRPNLLVRLPLKIISSITQKWCEVFMEMCIDAQATIGPGFYIGHIGGVHINPGAVLGMNCDVAHRVTIGTSALGRDGAPTVGDDVYIGTGATLIGKIRVGNGAKIAANSLIISNVPDGATVMGVPGRVVMRPSVAAKPTAPSKQETVHAD